MSANPRDGSSRPTVVPVYGPGLREVRTRGDPRKEGEAMARSEITQKIEELSEGRGFWPAKGSTTPERATT
jgi:hypothetical protein